MLRSIKCCAGNNTFSCVLVPYILPRTNMLTITAGDLYSFCKTCNIKEIWVMNDEPSRIMLMCGITRLYYQCKTAEFLAFLVMVKTNKVAWQKEGF
jgi:hypothetical protein